jgi:hypothetical protein
MEDFYHKPFPMKPPSFPASAIREICAICG